MDIQALVNRQNELLREVAGIGLMKRGTVSHQRVNRARGRVVVHPILSWKEDGKTQSLRLRTPEEVAWAKRAVDNYQRFVRLMREYEEIAGRIALSERSLSASKEAQKKGLKSPRKSKQR